MQEPIGIMGTLWQYGGAVGASWYLIKLVGYAGTGGYPQAVGTVLSSAVRAESGGSHGRPQTVLAARVEYEYEVGGRKFRNDVIDVGGDIWTGFADRAQAVRRRYPEGSVVAVYYDPADPKRSFLERSPAALLIVFAGCVGVLIAGTLIKG